MSILDNLRESYHLNSNLSCYMLYNECGKTGAADSMGFEGFSSPPPHTLFDEIGLKFNQTEYKIL